MTFTRRSPRWRPAGAMWLEEYTGGHLLGLDYGVAKSSRAGLVPLPRTEGRPLRF